MLLVDDDQADLGQRGENRQAGPDHEIDRSGPDPAPLVRPLAVAQARVEQGDSDVQLGPQAIDDRQGQGDLGHEQEARPAELEGRRDRLDIDGRLAAARHPVEQERRGVGLLEGPPNEPGRLGLRPGQARGLRPGPAPSRRPAGVGPPGPLADLDRDQAAPGEPGQGRRPVASGQLRPGHPSGLSGQLGQEVALAGTKRSPGDPGPGAAGFRRGAARRRDQDPALVARTARGRREGPIQVEQAPCREVPQPPNQAGPALRGGQVTDGPRPGGKLIEQRGISRRQGRSGVGRGVVMRRRADRAGLGDELEPLEHGWREHRPEDERRRGQVVTGDPARQLEAEPRQEWAVGPDPIHDGLELQAGGGLLGWLAEHDPERLAPAVLDEDRLAGLQAGQASRNGVGVRPGAGGTGRVDRDFDQPLERRRAGHQIRTRRSAWRAASMSMISPIRSAVPVSCPVSFTTT